MFNISSIPTDSFYKFLFISGLILIILPMYLMYNSYRAVLLESAIDGRQLSELGFEIKKDRITIDRLSKLKLTAKVNRDSLEQIIDGLNLNSYSISAKTKEISAGIKEKMDDNYMVFIVTIFCMLIGASLTLMGAKRWIQKIQLIQDRLLEIQLEVAERELKAKPSGRLHFEPRILPKNRAK